MKSGHKRLWAAAMAVFVAIMMTACMAGMEKPVAAKTADKTYQRDGLKLMVPYEFKNQLLVSTKPHRNESLFSVSEKASLEAAKAQHQEYEGAGWLFDIAKISKTQLEDSLCHDMSGIDVFAKDEKDNYFIMCHPTDVRYMREDNKAMERDFHQWEELTKWSYTKVPTEFIRDNNGLTPVTYDNSDVAIYLAQTAYRPDEYYTISSTEYRPVKPEKVNAAPYVEKLIRNVKYDMVDLAETPTGDFVILDFPADMVSLNFFTAKGQENYVREVHSNGTVLLFKASFKDSSILAGEVMSQWLNDAISSR
ncbi:hypothetical protein D081_2043 [Anaerovibrio sp. JC8]|uniref:hypothetical protein n=1 Tax=Anaerovibrio sp. JC8 TaxID=1240085 RepID=UPI000A0E0F10|nr:hypothetical protein [Anaerovibrio sp. JC8]ORT99314.1 hypothetical protein D081_2043 [Anaerovibrio sp. JC8]